MGRCVQEIVCVEFLVLFDHYRKFEFQLASIYESPTIYTLSIFGQKISSIVWVSALQDIQTMIIYYYTFFTKYVFSNANKGITKNFGCFEAFLKWAKQFLINRGILNTAIVLSDIVLVIMSNLICLDLHSPSTV